MNKELLEKVSAIREDLLALKAQVSDVRKLAEIVNQKSVAMWENYLELFPYMTAEQGSQASWTWAFQAAADGFLRTGKDCLTDLMMKGIPQMLADLDDIAEKLKASP